MTESYITIEAGGQKFTHPVSGGVSNWQFQGQDFCPNNTALDCQWQPIDAANGTFTINSSGQVDVNAICLQLKNQAATENNPIYDVNACVTTLSPLTNLQTVSVEVRDAYALIGNVPNPIDNRVLVNNAAEILDNPQNNLTGENIPLQNNGQNSPGFEPQSQSSATMVQDPYPQGPHPSLADKALMGGLTAGAVILGGALIYGVAKDKINKYRNRHVYIPPHANSLRTTETGKFTIRPLPHSIEELKAMSSQEADEFWGEYYNREQMGEYNINRRQSDYKTWPEPRIHPEDFKCSDYLYDLRKKYGARVMDGFLNHLSNLQSTHAGKLQNDYDQRRRKAGLEGDMHIREDREQGYPYHLNKKDLQKTFDSWLKNLFG